MAENKFQFTKPEGWRIIKPERYKDFSILSTEAVPCIYGFAVERKDGGFDVISMFDYGESSSQFIAELNAELEKLEANNNAVDNVNDYIKENASDYAVTSTSAMRPLFHKPAKMFGKNCFVNIMQISTNVGTSYSMQIFCKLAKHMICLGTSVAKLDEKQPFDSLMNNYQFINDMVNVLIKSIEEI